MSQAMSCYQACLNRTLYWYLEASHHKHACNGCRLGRKVLFIEGGVQMFICFVVVAAVMGSTFNKSTGYIPSNAASAILAFECLFTAGFAWSWGPMGWLVPSEFHNIETRGTGQAITVCVNFIFSFVIGQAYLTMLCK